MLSHRPWKLIQLSAHLNLSKCQLSRLNCSNSIAQTQLLKLPRLPSQELAKEGSPSSRDSTNSINQTFAAHAKSGLRNISANQSFTANPGRHVAEQARVSSGALTAVKIFKACSETKVDYHRFSRKFDLLDQGRCHWIPALAVDLPRCTGQSCLLLPATSSSCRM